MTAPPTTPRSAKAIAICVAATLALLAADLGTKHWAHGALSEERASGAPEVCSGRGFQRIPKAPIVLIEGYLEFDYAENCGAAFGLLRDADDTVRRVLFGVAALGAVIALFWMFATGKGGPWFAYSVPLVASGALGNLVDRTRFGYVVDFIRFHVYDKFEYPTFNVADIAIVVGVGCLVIDGFRKEPPVKSGKKGDGTSIESGKGSTKEPLEAGGKGKRRAKPATEASDG